MKQHLTRDASFLKTLEDELTQIFKTEGLSTSERLKAVETGAKLLMIRHRISGGADGEDGQFFSKGS